MGFLSIETVIECHSISNEVKILSKSFEINLLCIVKCFVCINFFLYFVLLRT